MTRKRTTAKRTTRTKPATRTRKKKGTGRVVNFFVPLFLRILVRHRVAERGAEAHDE